LRQGWRDPGILAGLLGLLTPVLTGKLVDELIPSAKREQLVEVFAILALSAITTWILLLLRSLAVLRMEGRMEAALQTAYWDRLLRLPAGFHRGYTAGDLAMRSLGISAIRQTLTGTAVSSILTGVFSLFGLGLMFTLNAALAGIGLVMMILAFAVTVAAAWIQIRLQRSITEKGGRLAGLLPQILGGIAKLRVAAAEDRAFARWAARFADQKREMVRGRRVSTWLQLFFGMFQAGTTMALFLGLFYVSEGRTSGLGLSTGAFLAFQSAFLQVLGGATQIGSALIGVLSVVPLYERAKPILETIPESTTGRADPGNLTGDLELNQIVFRYAPDSPPVLQGVSLRVGAGEFAAIVGPSGSGKSTLLRLLLGFENPESGSVFYDGQDLNGLDLAAVRRQAGVVLQSGGVLHGSIFDNIAGAAQLTMDDAWRAARLAGLEADIRAMPMGMHTLIPDGGLGLSGGQRQRLQIARAIVNQPKLIFFDEATSALDNQTQAIVMESLSALRSTRIVIAHRLSTIRNADRIFVLNKGQIEESGAYDELMAKKGLFEAMARRQLA
jgi:NHLM bacteriocin system ABC transporter ATP-binding protein